jgi:hypothetical protein
MSHFNTPILFLIFNRPEVAQITFKRIREIKPLYLFIAADGPRIDHPQDSIKCEQVRNLILDMIDWDCEVKTLLRSENLGCGTAVSEAITWFFSHVEEGIILEDDCLPDLSFFMFCEKLLEAYRDQPMVMHISGSNFQDGKVYGKSSYYFSAYAHIWGWAAWKRSWKFFDLNMAEFNSKALLSDMKYYGFTEKETKFWLNVMGKMASQKHKSTWDYQWMYALWRNKGFGIIPNNNIVTNIGFDSEGTHTQSMPDNFKKLKTAGIHEIKHADKIILNRKADYYSFKEYYSDEGKRSIKSKLLTFARYLNLMK